MFGVINLNKPAGWSSRDGVNAVARSVRSVKVGHAGTLDPIATGVLPICLGPATRLVEYAHRLPKSYRATFELGVASASDDAESPFEPLDDPTIPTAAEIQAALPIFLGRIEQRPPRHSAIKIAGRRAYKLARRGAEFDVAPRPVTIHRLEIVELDYPKFVLDVDCGTGTYVRSLGRDLAESLGTSAVMTALVRTAVGPLSLDAAVTPADLERDLAGCVLPATVFMGMLSSVAVTEAEVAEFRLGRPIRLGDRTVTPPPTPVDGQNEKSPRQNEIAALAPGGVLAAILAEVYPGLHFPVRNFTQPAPPE